MFEFLDLAAKVAWAVQGHRTCRACHNEATGRYSRRNRAYYATKRREYYQNKRREQNA